MLGQPQKPLHETVLNIISIIGIICRGMGTCMDGLRKCPYLTENNIKKKENETNKPNLRPVCQQSAGPDGGSRSNDSLAS